MTVSTQIVSDMADLAKLSVNPNELPSFANQMGDIIGYMSVLDEINTHVPPTNQVTGLTNVFRKDEIKPYPKEKKSKLLREVPCLKNGYVVVPHSITKRT
jgi:aspartyl-tRNA(Asn)/glutamyl-tRNA(Gln) amidotransferase subunit C